MVLPGHLAGGYIFTKALLAWTHAAFSSSQATALLIIGTLAGELPDIDLLHFYFANRSEFSTENNHRHYITHAPIFWLIISLVVALIGLVFQSAFIEYLGWIILGGSWSHLILDSIEDGIMWLWPLSHKKFALRTMPDFDPQEYRGTHRIGTIPFYWEYIVNTYIRTRITFYVEVLLTAAAIYIAIGL